MARIGTHTGLDDYLDGEHESGHRQHGAVMTSGIVTQDDSIFTRMVDGAPPVIQDLASGCRALIFDVLPETVEVVWPQQRIAGYGTGPRKKTEQFCWISPHTRHVVLGFYYGAELPDPEGVLEGTGRSMRHVKVRRAEDLDSAALRGLIEVAVTHRVPPPQPRA
jgi:hypothetical protein